MNEEQKDKGLKRAKKGKTDSIFLPTSLTIP